MCLLHIGLILPPCLWSELKLLACSRDKEPKLRFCGSGLISLFPCSCQEINTILFRDSLVCWWERSVFTDMQRHLPHADYRYREIWHWFGSKFGFPSLHVFLLSPYLAAGCLKTRSPFVLRSSPFPPWTVFLLNCSEAIRCTGPLLYHQVCPSTAFFCAAPPELMS